MQTFEAIAPDTEKIVTAVLDGAFRVHRQLGPGLLESVYETCLCHELAKAGVPFQRQMPIPIMYDGVQLEAVLRLDMLVGNQVIVELKTVEKMLPLYEAQMMTYLRLCRRRLGLLINFNVPLLKDGIKCIVL